MPKTINDSLYGRIELSDIAVSIIDTPEFQRLRYIHQLGVCYLVFPNATHTRFEHSIGVYHLAGEFLNKIKATNPQLQLLQHDIELVKIAGLVHDLGHGAFSHLLDNLSQTIPIGDFQNKVSLDHEIRSCDLLRIIYHKYNLSQYLSLQDIDQICNYIIPPSNLPQDNDYNFLYTVIANKKNDLDVDKLDYIARDTHALARYDGVDYKLIIQSIKIINGQCSYPSKVGYDIQQLFMTRYRLHKQIYNHHAVIGTEIIVEKILSLFRDLEGNTFKDFFKSYDNFIKLTDDILPFMIKYGPSEAKKYGEYLQSRKGYKLIKNIPLNNSELNNPQSHNYLNALQDTVQYNSVVERKYRFALCGGNYNPIEKILFRWPDGTISTEKADKFSPLTGNVNVEEGINLFVLSQ
jgi:HD superfamily phosphohydrolase